MKPISINKPGSDAHAEAGLRSDGELVQAASDDAFVFNRTAKGGFSDVSGLGTEITVAEARHGPSHTPEWTHPTSGDPGAASGGAGSDPEWRYVPVRRIVDSGGDEDMGFHWGDDSLL
ncbi:hypothetical protein [Maliponia aquimaris]|uniref:Uncharacterized protein n=1 Tax=Maliponia aquimaris TaxID=1673631 RepID=A0A238KMP2_9RHOB|nr:hypothetical protein [Maliponia aquimaris]SMX43316.1 hypothetical protein MAA8898_02795 [Maliponia aquimaris]